MKVIFSLVLFLSACTSVTGQTHLYTDTTYQVSKDKSEVIIMQNSLPKGGRYTDPAGKIFGYVIFWTHVVNKTSTPLELTISFPADSFTTLLRPGSVFELFLPPDTMTLDKESSYDFGAAGLKSFLDRGLNKPTRLQRTINPEEDYFFYIGILIHALPPDSGAMRTGLVLKGQQLFYRISTSWKTDSALVPCGQIVFKK